MKTCSRCRTPKQETDYYPKRDGYGDGLQNVCAECARNARRESYRKSIRNIRPENDIVIGFAVVKYEEGKWVAIGGGRLDTIREARDYAERLDRLIRLIKYRNAA